MSSQAVSVVDLVEDGCESDGLSERVFGLGSEEEIDGEGSDGLSDFIVPDDRTLSYNSSVVDEELDGRALYTQQERVISTTGKSVPECFLSVLPVVRLKEHLKRCLL